MRVAVVHDWLVGSGGAEKVTRELIDLYDADVFALIDHLNDADRDFILHGKRATTSFIQQLPFARYTFRNYLPLFPAAIERLDLRGYDLILSSSYAVAKGVRTHPGQKHICYIHTPMRYAWVDTEGYLREHGLRGPLGWFVRQQLKRLRRWDLAASARVDRFIANSHNVAGRVKRFYGREADVLLPPVDPEAFTLGTGPREHYLAVSRLVPYKRIDRIIEAFAQLPDLRLIIAGDGPERKRLQGRAGANVQFSGHVDQRELTRLLQGARAVVLAADEDLGLSPLEAHACGTPAIAWGKGGSLETVMDGENGILFREASAGAIAEAVRRFGSQGVPLGPAAIRASSAHCHVQHFRAGVRAIVEQTLGHA